MQVGLLGDLRPPRVDDDELRARPARAVDDRHDVEVRPRHVAAPGDDQLRVLRLLGADAGRRTERPDPRLGPDAAAEGPAIEQAGAELVEEPEVHRPAGQEPVRPGVVQRQDRLRAVGGDDGGESLVDDVERLGPRDALEAPLPLGAHPAQRRPETSLAVDEPGIRLRNLRAEDAGRVGIRARAPDRDDPLVLHRDGEAARVGTIEGADARVLGFHGLSPVIPVYTARAPGERAIDRQADEPFIETARVPAAASPCSARGSRCPPRSGAGPPSSSSHPGRRPSAP